MYLKKLILGKVISIITIYADLEITINSITNNQSFKHLVIEM